jgi:hypothetical protein
VFRSLSRLQLATAAADASDKQDQLSALAQQMADDTARLADAEASMAELQEQLRQQQSAAAAAAVRVSAGAETGGAVDDDLVAELEDRLLEAEQVREGGVRRQLGVV